MDVHDITKWWWLYGIATSVLMPLMTDGISLDSVIVGVTRTLFVLFILSIAWEAGSFLAGLIL